MKGKDVLEVLRRRKVQWTIVLVLLAIILFWSSSIRLSNLDLMTDRTTGDKIPLALDPFYFLRLSEIIVEEGELPEVDEMRYPSAFVGFSNEIMPKVVVWMYKIGGIFGSKASLRYVNVISPVIFFVLGILAFFFLIFFLTKSKSIALLSSLFLSFIPTYLYRTMAGFSDHESIGMFGWFLVLLSYSFSINLLLRQSKIKIRPSPGIGLLLGLFVGFLSAFSIASWGGGARFVFMIIPLSFFTIWIVKFRRLGDARGSKLLLSSYVFYLVWYFSSILFSLPYGYEFGSILGKYYLSSSGIVTSFVLLFLTVDYVFIHFSQNKFLSRWDTIKSRLIVNLLVTSIIGIIFVSIFKGNPIELIIDIISSILWPFGTGRVGLTVAENKQPYLVDWISQTGKNFFWIFVLGTGLIGNEISKKLRKKRWLFLTAWVILIGSILFSRYSSASVFNGASLFSQALYFFGVLFFFITVVRIYWKEDEGIGISPNYIIMASWLFIIIVAGRSAIRLFFLLTPFVCFMASFSIVKLFEYGNKMRDPDKRAVSYPTIMMFLISVIVAILLVVSLFGFINSISVQSKSTGPSANSQWQGAMNWIKESTEEGSIFIHWWDYGYWVQTLGNRPTVTDGGHAIGYWDHLIGRYLLTTPNPETAYSLMKAHDVSYLLIDPTDMGKYSAYSSIGNDLDSSDRFSSIPTMVLDKAQTQETSDGIARVYSGGMFVDGDIIVNLDGQEIFLPEGSAIIGGVIWVSRSGEDGLINFDIPIGVYYYNDQRYDIPLRYAYVEGSLLDFGKGLDAVVMVVPSVETSSINPLGSVVYLSPRVSKSLFAQLYLLDNVFGNYDSLRLAHSEVDSFVNSLNSQGFETGDFIFYAGAIRGPIKIWEVGYPENIIAREEFLRTDGEYGEFDNLEFSK